jgi:integrase
MTGAPTFQWHTLRGKGQLYLYVSPTGGRLWRLDYRFSGKRKTLSFGAYPAVSLKDARQKREEAKEQLAKGIDPGEPEEGSQGAAAAALEQAATFEAVGREWHGKKTAHLAPNHRKQLLSRLERQLFPYIGGIPFSKLEPADILAAVRHAEERGAVETAHRLTQLAGQVCRYARLCGYVKYDVTSWLTEVLQPVQSKHHAAITGPVEVGGHLLWAIDSYRGDISVMYALRIMPYVFTRSRELRAAEWREIDTAAAEWIIPPERMKMRRPHIIPLARQVITLLEALREHSGGSSLVFPSPFSVTRCISDMGLLNALRRMGYGKDVMTVHGFRSMASTLLNEQGYRRT